MKTTVSVRTSAIAWLTLLGAMVTRIQAATLTVTNRNDSGAGSLRQAILDANATPAADTITFAPNVRGTLALTSGELPIQSDITIAGPSHARLNINAGGKSRLFNITSGTVTISNLALTNGRVVGANGGVGGRGVTETPYNFGYLIRADPADPGSPVSGGAILNRGNLTLNHVVLGNNIVVGGKGGNGLGPRLGGSAEDVYASGAGGAGGQAAGGAIYNRGTLVISDTAFLSNRAIGGDGGQGGDGFFGIIYIGPGAGGVGGNALGSAILNEGTLKLATTTFTGNSLVGGKGGHAGRGWPSSGERGHTIGSDVYDPRTYKAPVAQSLTISGTQWQSLNINLPALSQGAPLKYSLVSVLPDGLVLDASTGQISGTPTIAGQGLTTTYNVSDGFGTSNLATITFNIERASPVASDATFSTLKNRPFQGQLQGQSMTQGGTLQYSLLSSLPRGLSLDAQSGLITGTPTISGQGLTTKYKVNDSFHNSNIATITFDIRVVESPSFIVTTLSDSSTDTDNLTWR